PFFIFFGWLSDKIGRKPIIMAGCALAAVLYFPLFGALTAAANPALAEAQERAPVTIAADPATCSVQFDPIGNESFDETGCDIAKSALAKAGIPYANEETTGGGTAALVTIGARQIAVTTSGAEVAAELTDALEEANYPTRADP